MKKIIAAVFSFSLVLFFLTSLSNFDATDEVFFGTEGVEENPYAALQYRYDMLRGKNDFIEPLARKRAIDYTKENLVKKSLDKSKNISSWSALGPGNIGGRIRSLILRPSNHDEMILGAVSGGIWKTYDGGEHWTPVKDDGEQLAISCMANNGDTVYAGTGEAWGNADAVFGGGILKSTDFGETWELLESTLTNEGWDFKNVRVIRIDNGGNIYAVTFAYNRKDNIGDFYNNGGLWKSTDGGESWTKISPTSIVNYYNGSDVMPVSEDVVLYVTQYGWLYRSTNGGETWTKITEGLPRVNDYNRVSFGQDPNDPNTVYAAFATFLGDGLKGIYKTTDGGESWEQLPNPPRLPSTLMNSYLWRQGWYDNVVSVNPHDSRNIYLGGVEMVRSFDGGQTWEQFAYGYPQFGEPVVHADHHAIGFHPTDENTIFDCNDGGIYKTTDGGDTWTTLNNGLEITQFYGGAVSYDDDTFQGGTQDNGHLDYSEGTSWTEIFGGDGGYAAIDGGNPKVSYEEYIYLQLHKTTDGGQNWTAADNGLDDASNNLHCLFIAPFSMNPDNSDVLIAGSDKVWLTVNGAELWTASSEILSDNNKISAVSVYNAEAPYLGFAGTTDGKIFKCEQLSGENDTWVEITPPNNNGAWVRDVIVNPDDQSKIYAVYSGFNNDNVFPTKHVWYSENAGETWTDISGNLPDVPVYSIIVNPDDDETIYLGTETGVYQTTDLGTEWIKAGSGMPDYVPVYDLVLQKTTGRIFAFTHGRGVFVSQVPLSVEFNGAQQFTLEQNYPNPFNPTTTIKYTIPQLNGVETRYSTSLRIYNTLGEEIATLVNQEQAPGEYSVQFDATGLASGVYFYTLRAGNFVATKKMVLLK